MDLERTAGTPGRLPSRGYRIRSYRGAEASQSGRGHPKHPPAAATGVQRRALSVVCPVSRAACGPATGAVRTQHHAHLSALFVFVGDPDVPATNNVAERSLRHLVTT